MYNIGNSSPVKLMDFIEEIERSTGKIAKKEMLSMQPGDVNKTFADVTSLKKNFNYQSKTPIKVGVSKFVDWYKLYYKTID